MDRRSVILSHISAFAAPLTAAGFLLLGAVLLLWPQVIVTLCASLAAAGLLLGLRGAVRALGRTAGRRKR